MECMVVTVGLGDSMVGLEDMGVEGTEELMVVRSKVMDIHHMALLRPYYD